MRDRVQRYPLQWPQGWKRTQSRQAARFSTRQPDRHGITMTRNISLNQAILRLMREADLLGAGNAILSTNVELRLDGQPRSGQPQPDDPGAVLYFELAGDDRCLACDRWTRVEDNVAAIAAHISAIRAVERYGIGTLEQAFRGYAALPPAPVDWWIVLQIPKSSSPQDVDAAYKALARQHHPDVGGDAVQMARINVARDAALAALEGR